MHSLKEKVCIVTGASSGIGEATALALANEGANVVLAARRKERLKQIEKKLDTKCLSIVTDISKKSDVENLINRTKSVFGRVDVLVNNAGILLPGFMEELNVNDWERMIDVNLKGVLYGIAAVLPIMKKQKSGHIINVASRGAHRVRPGRSVYSATKFAVRALSEGLRQEISKSTGIRVSVISPGAVDTEINHQFTEQQMNIFANTSELIPLRSEDIANAIIYTLMQPAHVNINEIMVLPTEQQI